MADVNAASRVRVIVVMGVSGAGKTTVGLALAAALGWRFHDADEFHSPASIAKMHRGEGLTDEDREPWLQRLAALISDTVATDDCAILACSALKQWYRDLLVPPDAPSGAVEFVYLDVPPEVLHERLAERSHHFAPPELLPSQLATLEKPHDAVCVDGTRPVPEIVHAVRAALRI